MCVYKYRGLIEIDNRDEIDRIVKTVKINTI